MTYKVLEVYGSFYVQYFRRGRGWLFYIGKNHIRFDTYLDAHTWIVTNKFGGNEVKAQLHIYHHV